MDVGNLIWIFFIIMMLQPLFAQRLQQAMRQRKIVEIERLRNSRVIPLIHRQETMRLLGFPMLRYIDLNDSEELLRAIHLTDPNMPLDIILHTPGGLVIAAAQIARALKAHKGKVTIFVPHYAMSGGTLIALAADQIVMSKHAVLGPVDPQIEGMPAASILKIHEEKPAKEIDDKSIVLIDLSKKAVAQLRELTVELLTQNISADKVGTLAEKLTNGHWTHDYAITCDEAASLGLNVSTDIPQSVMEMMTLYRQPVRGIPTVEYLPYRHDRAVEHK
ncbi:MAG: ATP-dependent Clp protease proteolytic subunit [Marinicaulis sp.]|nr:ATP-dependent Clp protease proteolytic subunit [Marinicaulis sp.]